MNVEKIINKIDALISDADKLLHIHNDGNSMSLEAEAFGLLTASLSLIHEVAGENSTYYKSNYRLENGLSTTRLKFIRETLIRFRADVDEGWLSGIKSLISAEIFDDFLEMAKYLLSEGYKDPAAVIIGSTLESHLRDLCKSHGISIVKVDNSGKSQPVKANQMNIDLTKAGVYSSLENKSVLAWLDLRNKAAHGQYGEYDKNHVENMLNGVRDFIVRNPA